MNIEYIKVNQAVKKFQGQTVLDNVSLTLKKGGIYGIVGRNGSGKTVLFKCICGFFTLDSGEISIDGKKMKKDINMLTDAGIIIEEPAFLRNYSGIKNLSYLYMIQNKLDKNYLCSVMEKVGLDPLSKKKVGKYSMGMRQRLAIAQAIMEDKSILILDEPMNGLDNIGVDEMRTLILSLKRDGKTILLASHNKEDINLLCDEIYEMDMGKLRSIY
jgi:ABC-2 type transport system ATP-binding protein